MGSGELHFWVYEDICFELAQNIEEADFPWTEEGVTALHAWLNQKYEERIVQGK